MPSPFPRNLLDLSFLAALYTFVSRCIFSLFLFPSVPPSFLSYFSSLYRFQATFLTCLAPQLCTLSPVAPSLTCSLSFFFFLSPSAPLFTIAFLTRLSLPLCTYSLVVSLLAFACFLSFICFLWNFGYKWIACCFSFFSPSLSSFLHFVQFIFS